MPKILEFQSKFDVSAVLDRLQKDFHLRELNMQNLYCILRNSCIIQWKNIKKLLLKNGCAKITICMQKTIEKVISIQYFILSREKKTFSHKKDCRRVFKNRRREFSVKAWCKKKLNNSKFPRKIKQELGTEKIHPSLWRVSTPLLWISSTCKVIRFKSIKCYFTRVSPIYGNQNFFLTVTFTIKLRNKKSI